MAAIEFQLKEGISGFYLTETGLSKDLTRGNGTESQSIIPMHIKGPSVVKTCNECPYRDSCNPGLIVKKTLFEGIGVITVVGRQVEDSNCKLVNGIPLDELIPNTEANRIKYSIWDSQDGDRIMWVAGINKLFNPS